LSPRTSPRTSVQTKRHPFVPRTTAAIRIRKAAEMGHDHADLDLVRLQSFALPAQEDGKGEPANGGDLGVEFPAQIRGHPVVAIQIPHQTAERCGEDRRYRPPQPERLGGGVQRDYDADDNEGRKSDSVE